MKSFFILIVTLFSFKAFAIGCDCEIRVYSPLTGSHQLPPTSLKIYELEEFSSYSEKNQIQCRESCQRKFLSDMPTERLNALLVLYSQNLINDKLVGYNCTGLTSLKYPVRVKASIGRLGLGNVSNQIYVVTHEEVCF